ncbi:MAG: hypothetical protein AMXMBFR33_22550 [Candidatus Xenobia bacterium]|jgi:anti-sigma factor RsiW
MNCQQALEFISQDVDGLLEQSQAEQLRHHLADCPACQKARQDFQTNRALMRSMSPPAMPEGAWGRLLEKIVSHPSEETPVVEPVPVVPTGQPARVATLTPRRWAPVGLKVFQAVAAMLVVFLGGLTFLGWSDTSILETAAAAGDHGAVIQGHALSQASDPLDDQARWHYLVSEPREVKGAQAIYQPPSLGYPPSGPVFGSPSQYAVPANYNPGARP